MKKYLTVAEYAKQFGLTRQGVYHRIIKKIIPDQDVKLFRKKVLVVKIKNKNHIGLISGVKLDKTTRPE